MIQTTVYYQRCLPQVAGVDEVVILYRHRLSKPKEATSPTDEDARGWPAEPAIGLQIGFWAYAIARRGQASTAQGAPITRWMRPAIRASKRLRRDELAFKAELDRGAPSLPMPSSDLQCKAMGLGRGIPCPYVRCAHHLGIDVMRSGALRVVYPHWDVGADDSEPTCVLAEAENGEHTAAEMGQILGIGANRIGQIESDALAKVAARMGMSVEELSRVMAAQRDESED